MPARNPIKSRGHGMNGSTIAISFPVRWLGAGKRSRMPDLPCIPINIRSGIHALNSCKKEWNALSALLENKEK